MAEDLGGWTMIEDGGKPDPAKGWTVIDPGDVPETSVTPEKDPLRRNWTDRFKDAFGESAQGGVEGFLARHALEDIYGYDKDRVNFARKAIMQEYAQRSKDDPYWRDDEGALGMVLSGRWAPTLLGHVLGNPFENLTPVGRGTLAARVGAQALWAGGMNSLGQGLENYDDVRDGFDPKEALEAAAFGAAGAGVGEAVGAGFRAAKGVFRNKADDALSDAFGQPSPDTPATEGPVTPKPSQGRLLPPGEGSYLPMIKAPEGVAQWADDGSPLVRVSQGENGQVVADYGVPDQPGAIDPKSGQPKLSPDEPVAQLPAPANDIEPVEARVHGSEGFIERPAAPEGSVPGQDIVPFTPAEGGQGGGQIPPEGPPPGGTGTPPGGNGEGPVPGGGQKGDKYAANINTERLGTDEEMDQTLRGLAENLRLHPQAHAETLAKAGAILKDSSPADIILRDPKMSEATEYNLALRTVLTSSLKRLNEASADVLDPVKATPEAISRMNLWRVTAGAAAEKASGQAGQAGRLLNQFNIIAGKDGKSLSDALRGLDEMVSQRVNPQEMALLINKATSEGGPAAAAKVARDSFKPRWEDYALSWWYNSLLSGPLTHGRNIFGNASNFVWDVVPEGTGAALSGMVGKRTDRATFGEVGQRLAGAMKAIADSSTYNKTGKAFMEGQTGASQIDAHTTVFSDAAQNVPGVKGKVARGAAMTVETPTRALSAEDEFFRNVFTSSSYYGEAYRTAVKEGLKGAALKARVQDLAQNPTKKMDEIADAYARRIQFTDSPSIVGRWVQQGKARNPNAGVGERMGRLALNVVLPFSRVADSTIRTVLRRSPLGFIDRYNLADFRAGGARRDQAIARMAVGTAALGVLASWAADDTITGDGPVDPAKRKELMSGGWQPNSVRLGGKYYSLSGLSPMANQTNIVANLVQRHKAGELTDEGYLEGMAKASRDLLRNINANSFTDDMGNFFKMLEDSPRGDVAFRNYIANLASGAAVPAIARQARQTFGDQVVRDTSGTSILGTTGNRIAATLDPESLPAQHDVYGNTVTQEQAAGLVKMSPMADDPAVKELQRLAPADKTLVTPAPTTVTIDHEKVKLPRDKYQDYQSLSGRLITESVRIQMRDPQWIDMSDDQKRKAVKATVKQMRKIARDQLFTAPPQPSIGEVPPGWTVE